jgi:elongation factor Tu
MGTEKFLSLQMLSIHTSQFLREMSTKPFLMPVEDIFSIEGRGTVVTGRIERGIVKVGEKSKSLESKILKRLQLLVLKCSTNLFKKVWLETTLVSFLRGLKKEDITRGQVLCKARYCYSSRQFHC